MTELSPCPFCDSDARVWEVLENRWRCFCTKSDCIVSVGLLVYATRQQAVAAWNARAAQSKAEVEVVTVQQLVEALKTYTEEDPFITLNYLMNTYPQGVKIVGGG